MLSIEAKHQAAKKDRLTCKMEMLKMSKRRVRDEKVEEEMGDKKEDF